MRVWSRAALLLAWGCHAGSTPGTSETGITGSASTSVAVEESEGEATSDTVTTGGSASATSEASSAEATATSSGTTSATAGPTSTSSDASTSGPVTTSPTEQSSTSSGESTTATTTAATSTSTSSTTTSSTTSSTSGGPPEPDGDGDGIPDADDPFPMDPDLPGQADPQAVYAQTADKLFTMGVTSPYPLVEIGPFTFDQSAGDVTDIAIDRHRVLYAITFTDLFVCKPQTAACYHLSPLPGSFNGMTMVPPGTLDPVDDTLVGITQTGQWFELSFVGGIVQQQPIGQYGTSGVYSYASSGDAYSILGVGTFGSTNRSTLVIGAGGDDFIVAANPNTGAVQSELTEAVGYTSIYGLAGWEGKIFAFDASGAILLVDPGTGQVTPIADTPHSWWGAGVSTVIVPI